MHIKFGYLAAVGALLGAVAAVVPASASQAAPSPSVIAEPDIVTMAEGTSGSFRVRLSHPPARSVPLMMSFSGTGIWGSAPVILIFTPTNWSTPQSYSVYSMQDADTVDDRAVVRLNVTGYTPDTVILQQIDDD